MAASAHSGLALATVTSASYLPGTLVLLHSFLRHHPGFDGDLVVIHDALPTEMQHMLSGFPNLRFHQVSAALQQRLDALIDQVPRIRNRRARYYSLETFLLSQYDRVLFCDSDLLFRGSIAELFALHAPLICCGDGPYYTGHGRDARTFLSAGSDVPNPLRRTFNAGLLLFDKDALGHAVLERALALIHPHVLRHASINDQIVFYQLFHERQHLVDARFNYLLLHHEAILQKTGTSLEEARAIHFNGRVKPWHLGTIKDRPSDPVWTRAAGYWHTAYQQPSM